MGQIYAILLIKEHAKKTDALKKVHYLPPLCWDLSDNTAKGQQPPNDPRGWCIVGPAPSTGSCTFGIAPNSCSSGATPNRQCFNGSARVEAETKELLAILPKPLKIKAFEIVFELAAKVPAAKISFPKNFIDWEAIDKIMAG